MIKNFTKAGLLHFFVCATLLFIRPLVGSCQTKAKWVEPVIHMMSESKKLKAIDDNVARHKGAKHHIFYVEKGIVPEDKQFYWVQAGFNTAERFQPLYNFYIDVKTKKVFYFDPARNKKIPFEAWEKL